MMKYIFSILMIASFLSTGILGCNRTGLAVSHEDENFGRDASYALGIMLGSNLRSDNIFPNMEEFTQGMKDVLFGTETRFTIEYASQLVQQAFMAIMEEREAENMLEEFVFLMENSQRPGVTTTESGLQYEILHQGTGPRPDRQSVVRVHYEGSLVNGMVFDSSHQRGEPIEFPLEAVIPGWTEGLQLMNVGSVYRFYIPSELGYGPQGVPPIIPPYSTLIFEVELIDIIE